MFGVPINEFSAKLNLSDLKTGSQVIRFTSTVAFLEAHGLCALKRVFIPPPWCFHATAPSIGLGTEGVEDVVLAGRSCA